jgi:hypothetical protein
MFFYKSKFKENNMKTSAVIFVAALLFCSLSANIFAQKDENVKIGGIKAAVVFPVGEWTDGYSTGFMVADITKWNYSERVRITGRMEMTFFGGKEVTQTAYPGYTYTYTTNPIAILTAGSGMEVKLDHKGSLYGILDFPSLNIILGQGNGFRVGLGLGFGYEFTLGKSLFGVEVRYNYYNALLTQSTNSHTESSQGALQLGFEAAF